MLSNHFFHLQVIEAINELTMKLVNLILWFSPVGIFFLIAGQFAGVSSAKFEQEPTEPGNNGSWILIEW